MNYGEAMNYIRSVSTRGIMPGLTRMEGLLKETGHPERACNIIHVAGTNGKGSVCTYLASILCAAGYKVGRYISPTLYGYRERIQINGRWISREAAAEWMTAAKHANDSMQSKGNESASAFELETLLAFLYFRQEHCDFIVLETGLGGRLDATNVAAQPVLSVITSIGMDHMHFLGDSIEAIAAEKGGIIKKGRPVVIGADNSAAEAVLKDICRHQEAPFRIVHSGSVQRTAAALEDGQFFNYGNYCGLHTGMPGSYQIQNAAIAIEAAEAIAELSPEAFPAGIDRLPSDYLKNETIAEGIAEARWPGRFEVIAHCPLMIVDGAHNPDGVRALLDSIRLYLAGRRLILVMGVFADKDYRRMLEMISAVSDTLIAFRPEQDRGLDAGILAETASVYFEHAEAAASQEEAVRKALSLCRAEDVVLSFGSLSTVAGLCQLMRGFADEKD